MIKLTANQIVNVLRKEFNLSREDIASKMRVSVSVIGYWERNERFPNYATTEKLKQILNGFKSAQKRQANQ